jgi:sensor histidine kinase regulating citrate/malate metabolism
MQGRDTIVVFTRTRTPVTDQKITVTGVVSTGVLNGETREALLESAP